MVRDQGDHLNTHYRAFPSPMGLALTDSGTRLAIGTADSIPAMDAFLKSGIPYDKRDLYAFLGQTKDVRAATILVRELASRERGARRAQGVRRRC